MKRIFVRLSLVILLSSSAALAQSPQPQAGAAAPVAAKAAPTATPPPEAPPLKENVTLSLKGTSFADTPVDWTWTGAGPVARYQGHVIDGERDFMLNYETEISAMGDRYQVHFYYTCNFPIIYQAAPNADGTSGRRSITFDPIGLVSTVILTPGVPVVIVDRDGKTLTLTLTKAATP